MADLSVSYLGLNLRNPIIVGSSGLTSKVESIRKLEENGAAAVVLKSLFEEQIMIETRTGQETTYHAEAGDYLDYYIRGTMIEEYLTLIREAKKAVSIPVIASISCLTANDWIMFSKRIVEAGADALELNLYVLPSDPNIESVPMEALYFNIIRQVKAQVTIPLAVKISPYFTNLANVIRRISHHGVAGIVLFNRFYNPDIDIEKVTPANGVAYSSPEDIYTPLRWVALTAHHIDCDMAAGTGIHDGAAVVKMLLAGANVVQMVSALYKHGPQRIQESLDTLSKWMDDHRYKKISDFRGIMSKASEKNPAFFERIQFLKHYGQM